ncbi:hypothetical protein GGR56DRAFT_147937 [Xylariaceae sp. FL0804]|nr:hypothetical protein GGR56DRAFT_147937 [Xylariaceae sp. FL0804]
MIAPRNIGQFPAGGLGISPAVFAHLPHDKPGVVPSIVSAVVCMVLSIGAVALRIYTRGFLIKQMGADDYMALAALAGVLAVAIIQCVHTDAGLGSYIYDVVAEGKLSYFFRVFYFGILIYNITLLLIKMTLFLQYYRFIKQSQKTRHIYLVIMGGVVAWTIGQIFTVMLVCTPIAGYWDRSVPSKCINEVDVQNINAIGNIVTDVIVLLLPMPVVWKLQLRPHQRWSLICIFSLGFFTCIISILRLIYFKFATDLTMDGVTLSAWTVGELTSAIICSSLPTLRPLAMKVFPRIWGSFKSSTRRHKFNKGSGGSGGSSTNNSSSYYPSRPEKLRGVGDLESTGRTWSETSLRRQESAVALEDIPLKSPLTVFVRMPSEGQGPRGRAL